MNERDGTSKENLGKLRNVLGNELYDSLLFLVPGLVDSVTDIYKYEIVRYLAKKIRDGKEPEVYLSELVKVFHLGHNKQILVALKELKGGKILGDYWTEIKTKTHPKLPVHMYRLDGSLTNAIDLFADLPHLLNYEKTNQERKQEDFNWF